MTSLRQPLAELQLDLFLSKEGGHAHAKGASLKRPHSPATLLLSPSKRRVLNAEGVSPFALRSPSRLSGLSEHRSPARKLDFGVSKTSQPFPTPSTATTASITATTSSKIASHSESPTPEDDEEDPFTTPRPPAKLRLAPSPNLTPQHPNSHEPAVPRRDTSEEDELDFFRSESRKEPSVTNTYSIDRNSIHYPGFDVHYDPCAPPPPKGLDRSVSVEEDGSLDVAKENIPSRRKMKKAVTVPLKAKDELLLSAYSTSFPSGSTQGPHKSLHSLTRQEAYSEERLVDSLL